MVMTRSPAAVGPTLRSALVVAALSSIVLVGVVVAPQSAMPFLQGESGIIEIVSALAYPVGAWFALQLARQSSGWNRAHWVMWSVLCVLFFGEETSWLQHWLGYATPESIKAVNEQSEFNLHNLRVLSAPQAIVGASGAHFSWKLLLSAQNLFYAGFAVYFVLLPLAMRSRRVAALAQRVGAPSLGPAFVLMVAWTMALSVALSFAYRHDMAAKVMIAETREMFCALFIAGFIAMAYAAARRRR
ncbi:MAG: hypothetical protein JWM26_2117 [Betaproteobacteria bacterium]|nr:hypothetical protein [Betaproteobacteria bacterium]